MSDLNSLAPWHRAYAQYGALAEHTSGRPSLPTAFSRRLLDLATSAVRSSSDSLPPLEALLEPVFTAHANVKMKLVVVVKTLCALTTAGRRIEELADDLLRFLLADIAYADASHRRPPWPIGTSCPRWPTQVPRGSLRPREYAR